MTQYVVFNNVGVILRTGFCPVTDLLLQSQAGESVIEGSANDLTDYVDIYDYYKIKPKPQNPATINKNSITADGTDTATISNIPTDCVANVDGTDYTITDGELAISTTVPGTITVRLSLFPYLDKTIEVTAG